MTTHQIQSLLLAILSALSFAGVGFSVAAGKGWLALVFIIAAILLIGTGFILKRMRRKEDGTL